MNKSWFYLGAIGSLAILTTSCGGDSKPAAPAAPPTTTASPAPTAATPAPAPAAAAPPIVPATPTVATTKPATTAASPTDPATATTAKLLSVDLVAGLIPPTDGDNWAKTVAKGRPDPFAMLALQPIEVAEKDPLNITGKPQSPSGKIASNSSSAENNPKQITTSGNKAPAIKSGVNKSLPSIKIASIPSQTSSGSGSQKIASKGLTSTKAVNSPIAKGSTAGVNKALPKKIAAISPLKPVKTATIFKAGSKRGLKAAKPIPANASNPSGAISIAPKPAQVAAKPLQAMAIEISGVMEVAGKTQVIVKLPSESFSRYIEVGDRVANGKVLIKRVEGQQTLSPIIVLEEVGVEVPRKIGDRSASNNSTAPNPTATPPNNPTTPPNNPASAAKPQ